MIRRCTEGDFDLIWQIINDGARAYDGVIPADRWKEPYMSREELRREMHDGVEFWGCEEEELCGVMGLQSVKAVTLIRHAYVRTHRQQAGIGAITGTSPQADDPTRSDRHLGPRVMGNPFLSETWLSSGHSGRGEKSLSDSSANG